MNQPSDTEGSAHAPALVSDANIAAAEVTAERPPAAPIPHYSVAIILSTTTTQDHGWDRSIVHYDTPII
ncbi:MAG: hypothetical protein K2Q32_04415, partial [Alphaproteobacteria bacterium]|nr:hypothetical protein [Alphaproteobacteria bacterium]